MIETAMLVVLGFCIATLLALAVLPFVTRRAARLAGERLQETLPLSADEIVADRDGLRAEAAIAQRRLEQRLGHAETSAVTRTVELGHRTAELAGMQERRDADEAARRALVADLDRTQERLSDAQAQCDSLQRKIDEADARRGEADRAAQTLQTKCDRLEALAEEHRGTVAGLETRCSGLEMRRDNLEADVARHREDQDRLRAAVVDVTRERDIARTEVQVIATQRAILQDDLTEATRRAETYRLRFDARADALDRAEQKLVTEKADRLAAQAALSDLRRRFEQLESRLIDQGGRTATDVGTGELEALRAEIISVADRALEVLGADAPGPITVETGPGPGEPAPAGRATAP